MLTIEMTEMRFHAFHGVYDFEKRDGAPFEVNLSIDHIQFVNQLEEDVN